MKKTTALFLSLSASLLICTPALFSQNVPTSYEKNIQMHQEKQVDAYLPNAYGNRKTSPAFKSRSTGVFTSQVNVNASGANIIGDAANEPSIAMDPNNSGKIVIGWRQFDNISSNFRQAGYAFTLDSGNTWTNPGVFEPGVFRSDPVLDSDSSGNFYYNSLTYDNSTLLYVCKVFKSETSGNTWNSGVDAKGGDKQWMVIDKSGGVGLGNIYSFWTSYYSSCQPWYFTRSVDDALSFETCTFPSGNPYWGTMAVGPEGELYLVGNSQSDGLVVTKSTNAKTPGSAITWDFYTMVYMDGYLTGSFPINPVGILGQGYIDVDISKGPGRGNVYIMASMPRISNNDSADVMFARSTDGGETWSDPIRINDDPGTDRFQWFGVMSVAPNGRIDAAWLDTRDAAPGSHNSALYYSFSIDQGLTWSQNEKISEIFDPHIGYPQQAKMGDYFDMVSDESSAHLAWANTLNGEEDVYYSRIIPTITGINDKNGAGEGITLSNYPNPFKEKTVIRYSIPATAVVKVDICSIYGSVIRTVVSKYQQTGSYSVDLTGKELPAGYYFCRLTVGNQTKTIRLVKI